MAFLITHDLLQCEDFERLGIPSRVGTKSGVVDLLKAEPFKLRDDDGEDYYEGIMSGETEDDLVEPLAWAMRDAGATELLMRGASGEWEVVIG